MGILGRKSHTEPPRGLTARDVKIESSICTGETVIGFFDKTKNKLIHEELVLSKKDILAFYKRYGLEYKEK